MKAAAAGALGLAGLGAVYYNQSGETELFSHRMHQHDYDYMRFVSAWGKSYGTKAEYNFRKEQWRKTDKQIKESNKDENNTFTLDHNEFSDWTEDEMSKLLGYKEVEGLEVEPTLLEETYAAEVDWRQKGAVTKVKNQERCGSCWAFSSTGSIEGARFVQTGDLVSLSEEQLVECSKRNEACNGGSMVLAFMYTETAPLETESDYPYTSGGGKKGACKYEKSKGVGKVAGYKMVTPHSPAQLKAAVDKGPVSIAVEADKSVFQQYKTGIINSRACGEKLDHGVLAVGYGEGYFIVKNSWGPSWGDEGYLKISDSSENICGILSQPVYPTE